MSLPPPGPGRTAVVTGASGGIGAEIARELSRRGHHVTLVARSVERLEALADELGGNADVLPTDLADRAARAALLGHVAGAGRTADVLVNNAGWSTLGPVSASDPDAEMEMIEVDVAAVADLCSRVLPGMLERRRGAVLNVASTAAFQPLPGQAGYAAAKAFVLSYTQSLATELRGSRVTATALCPGPVRTAFGERAGFEDGEFEGALPGVMWVPADEVARVGVEAMAKGRGVAIPGMVNRVGAALAQVTPRSLLLPALARAHPGLR